MKHRLLVTSAICGLSLLATSPAFAACTSNVPGGGSTVFCNDADTTGVSGGANSVTVNVGAAGSINPAGFGTAGIVLGNNALMDIEGAVNGNTNDGITIGDSGNVTVRSGGSVTGSSEGIEGNTGLTVNIHNGGSVSGNTGIYVNGGTANITVNGTLTGTGGFALDAMNSSFTFLRYGSNSTITGNVNASTANTTDIFRIDAVTNTSFNTNLLGTQFNNFEVFQKDNTGTTTLTGTGGQDWSVNVGTLSLTDAATIDDAAVSAGATLLFDDLDGTYSGDVSGAGNWTIQNDSIVTLSGDNNTLTGDLVINTNNNVTFADSGALTGGDISVNQSTLTFGDAMTVANDITIGANDATFFAGAGQVVLNGVISGATGRLIKDGASNLVLTGTNTFGDGLIISNGRVTGDSVTALGSGAITNNAQLVIDLAAGSETLNLLMSGTGVFEKRGAASTLTVTGNHTMSGDVYATQGTLMVNGSLGSAANTYIANNATLGGTGTVANVDVLNGGTFAPGNSIGTINVNGTLDFASGSTYAVEYNAAGQSDKTIATGAVTINAGAILSLTGAAGNYATNTDYTIIQGASVTGTFGTVNNNLAYLDATQNIVGGNSLVLRLTRNDTSFADVLNTDEQDVGNALDELANDLTTAFTALTTAQAQDAASTLSNEHQGSTATFIATANTSVLTNMSTRLGHAFGGTVQELAAATPSDTYVAAYIEPAAGGPAADARNVWFQAIGSIGSTDSSASEPSSDRHSFGGIAGIDIPYAGGGVYGFFAGYERGEVETDSQNASSEVGNYHIGAYSTRPLDNGLTLNSGLALTWHDIDSVRYVVFPGFQAAPHSDTNGYSASAFAEISKPMQYEGTRFAPFAGLTLAHTSIDGYEETGGGLANLVVDDSTVTNPITTLGVRFAGTHEWGDRTLDLNASIGWQHVFGDIENETDMRFQTGTTTFQSSGAPRARDAALVSVGFSTALESGVNAYAAYDGTLAPDSRDHGFRAGVKVKF